MNFKGYTAATLRGDLYGALTSTVVALPVALAFGIASGLGAAAGLYGAIAVGFFAAVFGGTPSQISGPTPSMTVAMAVMLTTHASSIPEALVIVVMAGLLQISLGALKLGRFVVYTPAIVVSGFMSGIGIIIILVQITPFLGVPAPPGGPTAIVQAIPDAIANANPSAVAIGAATLIVGFVWPPKFAKYLPPALVSLAVGVVLGIFVLTGSPQIGQIPTELPTLSFALPSASFLVSVISPALILALLGSVDSLLTSLVADSLTGERHKPDRELIGQGMGNTVAGLFGGLPGAGATMGTVTNIRAGGSTPVSGALRSVFLLALVLGMGDLVAPIPLAALAGILIKVGWDVIDWWLLSRLRRLRRQHIVVMLVTVALTVFVDLVTAVAIGLIVAGMTHAQELEELELDRVVSVPILDQQFFEGIPGFETDDPFAARVGLVELRGRFTVASAHKLAVTIGGDIRDHDVVVFDFARASHLDDSAAMLIRQLLATAKRSDTDCILTGATGRAGAALDALGVLDLVSRDQTVPDIDAARPVALRLLEARAD